MNLRPYGTIQDTTEPNVVPQLPHGVCHADDPNLEAIDREPEATGSATSGSRLPQYQSRERGDALSVSHDGRGTKIAAGTTPTAQPQRVMVPREPTDDMLAPGEALIQGVIETCYTKEIDGFATARHIWQAMYDAATPGSGEGG